MRKRALFFIIVASLIILLPASIFAHPGRTDSNGGHYNRSTGEYHYHHGYPEHQHKNGVCPYEEKTNGTYSPSRTAEDVPIKKMTSAQETKISYGDFFVILIIAVVAAVFIGLGIYYWVIPFIDRLSREPSDTFPCTDTDRPRHGEENHPDCTSVTQEDLLDIYNFFGDVMREPKDSYKRGFVLYLAKLSPEDWEKLERDSHKKHWKDD